MFKRIMKFDKKDWGHCLWLFKNMIKCFLLFNFYDAELAWFFLKLHLTHDSTRLN
jgi:hypothetical protein